MTFELHSPYALLLLLLVPALILYRSRRGRGAVLKFPSTRPLAAGPRSWRQRLAGVPSVLRYAA